MDLLQRIDLTTRLEELLSLAGELECARKRYRIDARYAPKPGDAEVKKIVMDSLLEPLSTVQKFVVETLVAAVTDEEEEMVEAMKHFLWHYVKEALESIFGEFAAKLSDAIKSRSLKKMLEAAAAAAEAVKAKLGNRESIVRQAIREMKGRGLVANESKVRKLIERWTSKFAERVSAVVKLLSSPIVIAVRVFFTPTATVDTKGELYTVFQEAEERLYRKLAKAWEQRFPAPNRTYQLPSLDRDLGPTIRANP
jgi:hypothetical protein